MKKILYIIIPIAMIAVFTGFFRNKESSANPSVTAESNCLIAPQEFLSAEKEEAIIIDVRTKPEYDYGHVNGAILIDVRSRDFRDKIAQLDKSKTYYVYCKTGIRSRSAASYMRQAGFSKVCDIQSGLNGLARAGVQFVK
jgi:rhodanese-related sulfurtransferase